MIFQALAIAWIGATSSFTTWAVGAVLLGAGTAMVYPTLLAAIGDVANPTWRARAVVVYRLWRDSGFAVGALLAGILADLISITAAIYAVAALTALSGAVVGNTHERNSSAMNSNESNEQERNSIAKHTRRSKTFALASHTRNVD
ncbi:hypothetical protein EMGBS4_04630 [Acidimicrobiaceae bacterium]|nr:hypothetical protein EMGBS4_04630 [Acidimicrobiaceae bacterium]